MVAIYLGCHCEAQVLRERKDSVPLRVSSSPENAGTNELTFLSHAHSRDMTSESEQAENEKGILIFLFPANRLYLSPVPNESFPLHRWVHKKYGVILLMCISNFQQVKIVFFYNGLLKSMVPMRWILKSFINSQLFTMAPVYVET